MCTGLYLPLVRSYAVFRSLVAQLLSSIMWLISSGSVRPLPLPLYYPCGMSQAHSYPLPHRTCTLDLVTGGEIRSWPLSFSALYRSSSWLSFNRGRVALTTWHGMLSAHFHKVGSSWVRCARPSSFLLQEHDFVKRSVMQEIVGNGQAKLDLVNNPVFAVDFFNSSNEE